MRRKQRLAAGWPGVAGLRVHQEPGRGGQAHDRDAPATGIKRLPQQARVGMVMITPVADRATVVVCWCWSGVDQVPMDLRAIATGVNVPFRQQPHPRYR